jgi:hypothetical protein
MSAMRTPRAYLETSVFNFVFTDDAPELKKDTLKLFEEIRQGKYEPYASVYVVEELEDAHEPKRTQMLNLITDYNITMLETSDEADSLADIYVTDGIIPRKYVADARHIAIASVHGLDFIVSLNFKHIVKRKTVMMAEVVNLREGYNRIGIFSPKEVIDDEEV